MNPTTPPRSDRNVTVRRRGRTSPINEISFGDISPIRPRENDITIDPNITVRRSLPDIDRDDLDANLNFTDSDPNITLRGRRRRQPSMDSLDMTDEQESVNLDIGDDDETPMERPLRRRGVSPVYREPEEFIDAEAINAAYQADMKKRAVFDIEEFDQPEQYVELPVVEMKLSPKDVPVYDVINLTDMSLNDFLSEDEDNIVFKFHNQPQWMGVSRKSLEMSVQNPSQIVYECEDFVKKSVARIYENTVYFQLRAIGFTTGVIEIHDVGAILRDTTDRMYELTPSDTILKTTMAYGFKHYRIDSSNMCGPNNGAVVYNVRKIRIAEVGGTRKIRNRTKKHRRGTKTRRGHKKRHGTKKSSNGTKKQ